MYDETSRFLVGFEHDCVGISLCNHRMASIAECIIRRNNIPSTALTPTLSLPVIPERGIEIQSCPGYPEMPPLRFFQDEFSDGMEVGETGVDFVVVTDGQSKRSLVGSKGVDEPTIGIEHENGRTFIADVNASFAIGCQTARRGKMFLALPAAEAIDVAPIGSELEDSALFIQGVDFAAGLDEHPLEFDRFANFVIGADGALDLAIGVELNDV